MVPSQSVAEIKPNKKQGLKLGQKDVRGRETGIFYNVKTTTTIRTRGADGTGGAGGPIVSREKTYNEALRENCWREKDPIEKIVHPSWHQPT